MTPLAAATSRPWFRRFSLRTAIALVVVGGSVLLWLRWGRSPSTSSSAALMSNYDRYVQADLAEPIAYEFGERLPRIDPNTYHAVAPWTGRLVLPPYPQAWPDRSSNAAQEWVWLELHNAPAPYDAWEGQFVRLQWSPDPTVQNWVNIMAQPVVFSGDVATSLSQGIVHPTRLNGWSMVGPLQSLAGARSRDDVIVQLNGPVVVDGDHELDQPLVSAASISHSHSLLTPQTVPRLSIQQMPTQIGGHWYGLVKFLAATNPPPVGHMARFHYFQVQHFNPQTQRFDGAVEVVRIPDSIPDRHGLSRLTLEGIERSPLNADGWYMYGNQSRIGTDLHGSDPQFVVQALAPRAMVRLQPNQVITGKAAGQTYIAQQNLNPVTAQQNTATTVWVRGEVDRGSEATPEVESLWKEGDRALVLHVYGGIGGKKGEPTMLGLTPGHFAYGTAEVVRDPLSAELQFEIDYHQVYAHNVDGIVSGSIQWAEYMGNVQRGWQGTRPISDVIIHFPPVTEDYDFDGVLLSPLNTFVQQLTITMARYRVGDGTGSSTVSPISSCVQDSNQALYTTIKQFEQQVQTSPTIQQWLSDHPHHPQTLRFQQLVSLGQSLERQLAPLGIIRTDWQNRTDTIAAGLDGPPSHEGKGMNHSIYLRPELAGISTHSQPWSKPRQIMMALASWRTVLPRRSHDEITSIFLEHGAQIWFIRTNQIGGANPAIAPRVPNTLLGS